MITKEELMEMNKQMDEIKALLKVPHVVCLCEPKKMAMPFHVPLSSDQQEMVINFILDLSDRNITYAQRGLDS